MKFSDNILIFTEIYNLFPMSKNKIKEMSKANNLSHKEEKEHNLAEQKRK